MVGIVFGLEDNFGGIVIILSTQELACLSMYADLLVSV